ncbi:MAG: hypothetical protein U0T75_15065 [Chitinophagales bacterium]
MALLCTALLVQAADYTGDNLLRVLGQTSNSADFNSFRDFWLLDKKLESTFGGLKVMVARNNSRVDTLMVAGNGCVCNGTGFMPCTSPLPFGLQLNDSKEVMADKMQGVAAALGRNYVISTGTVSVLVQVKESQTEWIKFFNTTKELQESLKPKTAEVKSDPAIAVTKIVTPVTATISETPKKENAGVTAVSAITENESVKVKQVEYYTERPAVNAKLEATRRALEQEAFNSNAATAGTPVTGATAVTALVSTAAQSSVNNEVVRSNTHDKWEQTRREVEASSFNSNAVPRGMSTNAAPVNVATNSKVSKTKAAAEATVFVEDPALKNASAFKRGIMNVFNSYRQSAFSNIKVANRGTGNFWNYKYTYSTRLKIPGEKFNMLYSFPFPTSQLDFVSVLAEGDGFDESFRTTYKQMEQRLMENFPASEGWVTSCLPNKESGLLSDLEVKNEKYGSIVLDYSKSPKGRHVLYLRFLLYSN